MLTDLLKRSSCVVVFIWRQPIAPGRTCWSVIKRPRKVSPFIFIVVIFLIESRPSWAAVAENVIDCRWWRNNVRRSHHLKHCQEIIITDYPNSCKAILNSIGIHSNEFLLIDGWAHESRLERQRQSTVFTTIENLCLERVKPGEKVYFAYFGVRVGDQDKSWPRIVASSLFRLSGSTLHVA